jgi:hypothetical protein
MKTTRIMLLAAVLLGALPAMGSAATSISAGLHIGPSGRANVDVGFFYDDLASYGNWVQRPRYGWVWTPRAVAASWRPYQAGHWVWTDLGWSWVSDEPYGWATYHYGRWYDDPDYGWGWVPGDQWAPAWVDWHAGNDYVGWAPLPPSYDYRPGVTVSVDLSPDAFIFVPENRFLETRLVSYAAPRWECDRIYRGTRSFTRYDRFNNQVFNAGFPVDRVQQWTGRRVQRYQVADLGWNQRHQGGRFAQNRVAFFRPQVERNARVAAPTARPLARRAVLAGAAATAAVNAHHAFRAAQANQVNRQSQALLRQQGRAQRQAQAQGRQAQIQQQQGRQQLRLQGRQQRQQAQQQARLQQQQGRELRQTQVRQQQQTRQLQRSQRQDQQRVQAQARVEQRQGRAQRQALMQQQQQGRQQQRFQRQQQQQAQAQARSQQQQQGRAMRQQQQQARQQERSQQQQARAEQRPQRQMQQAQAQQARQQARQQRQGNPGQQGQGRNHGRQRPPQ